MDTASQAPLIEVEKQSQLRSLLKSISWRFIATITTFILTFIISGELQTAFKIGPADFVLKLLVFYLHERLWLTKSAQQLSGKRLLKTISWKVVAVSMTISITYYVTKKLSFAFQLGPADFVAKLILYHSHEYIWDLIQYGREKEKAKAS